MRKLKAKTIRLFIGANIYGIGNIGDDAILQGLVRSVKEISPAARISVATFHGNRLGFLHNDVECVDYCDNAQVVSEIKECDCFICGGGTLIGEELGLAYPLGYVARLVSLAKYYGKKVLVLSIGANSVSTFRGKVLVRTILSLADLVTVRDDESRSVCLSLGGDKQKTFVVSDAAYELKGVETKRSKHIKETFRKKNMKLLAVNVVDEVWAERDEYKKSIAEACDIMEKEYGYFPCFINNDVRPDKGYDYLANCRTKSFMCLDSEVLEPVYLLPCEMIDLLGVFDCVISMRMHFMIFSSIAVVPYVAVSRIDKVDNHMKLFGRNVSGNVDCCDSNRIVADLNRALASGDVWRAETVSVVEDMVQLRKQERVLVGNELHSLSESRRKVTLCSLYYVFRQSKTRYRLWRLMSGDLLIVMLCKLLCKQERAG